MYLLSNVNQIFFQMLSGRMEKSLKGKMVFFAIFILLATDRQVREGSMFILPSYMLESILEHKYILSHSQLMSK